MPIDALRTPEDRFSLLPGFPYPPRYADDLPGYAPLRMHYVDAGEPDAARVFLCLHGEPTWSYLYRKMIPVFTAWKTFAALVHDVPTGGLIATDAREAVTPLDVVAYEAPFPDASYKAGVRRFPQLVPVEPGMAGIEHCRRAREFLSREWEGDSFMAIGERDAVLGGPVMDELRSVIRGCPEPMRVPDAGHFIQEYGEPVARRALDHFGLA